MREYKNLKRGWIWMTGYVGQIPGVIEPPPKSALLCAFVSYTFLHCVFCWITTLIFITYSLPRRGWTRNSAAYAEENEIKYTRAGAERQKRLQRARNSIKVNKYKMFLFKNLKRFKWFCYCLSPMRGGRTTKEVLHNEILSTWT